MIDHRNTHSYGHILTLEDPIEFMHEHKKSVVDQREVSIDTWSFDSGLKNAMRQAPDLILIGEVRDMNSMKNALAYAETGHLCLATLHANSANQAVERVVSFFPEEGRAGLLMAMSMNLVAIVSQRLVSGLENKRISATEVMINTPYMAELIQKHRMGDMKEVMSNNNDIGMMTFDQVLFKLFANGKIREENALANADSRNDLSLRIRFAAEATRRPSLGSI
jgi:twitching motility protein PilU